MFTSNRPIGNSRAARVGRLIRLAPVMALIAAACLASGSSQGVEINLHSFTKSSQDAQLPYGSLTLGADGATLYGMTSLGGNNCTGTIFKIGISGSGYTILHWFAGGTVDGAYPYGTLALSADGTTLYGMTYGGGSAGAGTIFSIKTDGSAYKLMYSFQSGGNTNDGANPYGALTLSADGTTLYGMTYYGGTAGAGTIFSIPANSVNGSGYVSMYSFGSNVAIPNDAANPIGSLTLNAATSVLYGMTSGGGSGSGAGTVFSIPTNSTNGSGYHILYSFGSNVAIPNDGADPIGSLTLDSTGTALYGMTRVGGSANAGIVFSMTTAGVYNWMYSFAGGTADGGNPEGNLTLSVDGSLLYGMTVYGGSSSGDGAVFSISTASPTSDNLLYAFSGKPSDGAGPTGSLTLITNGSTMTLYGLTESGGAGNFGTFFTMNTNGTSESGYQLLYSFGNTAFSAIDGEAPYGDLTPSADGKTLFGMTEAGGDYSNGTIFAIQEDGSGYTLLHSFGAVANDGAEPFGKLTLSGDGTTLYGMTVAGGSASNGMIFSIKTDGSAYTPIYSFGSNSAIPNDGANPYGSLTLSADGTMLYGMTEAGGSGGYGTVFSIPADSVNGSGYSSFSPFTGAAQPDGNLTQVGSKLYGLTWSDGAHGYGTVFSIGTNGSGYTIMYSFAGGTADGGNPNGSLTLSADGNTFYGMTVGGGANNGASTGGTVFSIPTNSVNGSGYKLMYSFGASSTDGNYPYGNLTRVGSTLYGMTSAGGAGGYGIIFSIPAGSTNGSGYQALYSFGVTAGDGESPDAALTLSADGASFYGMTNAGGIFSVGMIFEFSSTAIQNAAQLAFVQPTPPTAQPGAAISPVTVQVEYADGSVVTTDNSNVTVAILTGTGSGTLGGTPTVRAVNGQATFSGLSISNAGTYTLQASDGALLVATMSIAIQVSEQLAVQSTPVTGLSIASTTGDAGTTNYTVANIPQGTSVNLQAPATDPAGYTFSQWALNGTAQTALQKSITFAISAATTASAQYALNTYSLTVQSTPPTGVGIGSGAGFSGTTDYTASSVAYGTSVDLQAPLADPSGYYTFSQWTLNGVAQTPGAQTITFTMTAATTAVAQYVLNTYTLAVQSTPTTGLSIGSTAGCGGTTNYAVPGVAQGTSVDLEAPAADPGGLFTFAQWTLNGAAQTAGVQAITFTMTAATTAVAQYTPNSGTLAVQSTPPAGLAITSITGYGGTTDYTFGGIASDTSVDLTAPPEDPAGDYTFSQWTLNGVAQTPGAQTITFTMTAGTLAVAQYTPNVYTLNVQSTPPSGLSIASSTGDAGTTNYTASVMFGASVNLRALAADPAGYYTFSQWTVNGAAQTAGVQAITFPMPGATTAVAQYTLNTYTLNVQSTPPTALSIGSSTGFAGTTNYTVPGVAAGTSVDLQAPAADPTGYYSFSQWTLNGVAQTDGQPFITFTMTAATTAVAQYTLNTYTLSVQSTPPTGLSIGSSTGDAGTTDYTIPGVAAGTSVNVQAPAADPGGYFFLQWAVNGVAQTAGVKSITFSMTAATTAVAQYAPVITVRSQNPASGVTITISPADLSGASNGVTPLTRTYSSGTSITLTAPLAASGNNFQKWQMNGSDYTTNAAISVTAGPDTYTAVYLTPTAAYTLAVQSTPPTGLVIASSTGHNGTTNYTKSGVGNGTVVNLAAPAVDPAGYVFLEWTVNGAAQSPGQKSITLTMAAATTAVAQYGVNGGYTLSVQSAPPSQVVITSSTGQGGTTNYTVPGIRQGTNVSLQAPATDPSGYTFTQWTVNGAAQSPGQKGIAFMVNAAVTAVAQYSSNTSYALSVQSAPPTGLVIASSTGQGQTTNYVIAKVAQGTVVNLQAPAAEPAGYTFSQWTVNGAAQSPGQKSVTFAMASATTAVARYTANAVYALTVQSTPPTGVAIGSSTGQGGTTNYSKATVPGGSIVELAAPGTDPANYTFWQWVVNGAAQPAGQKSVTFAMVSGVTAVARYTLNAGYTLTVQSTPPGGVSIGSSTGQSGTTSYSVTQIAYGTGVNLVAPANDPANYSFSEWTLNGAAQAAGQKGITFTMDGAVTAVAHYSLNSTYALAVQSTPPGGVSIGSSTGNNGTTNYTNTLAYGTMVNLSAPANDPAGYTFAGWTVNGTAQAAGQKSVTFAMASAVTAVARYTANATWALAVQSTPAAGVAIGSSTGQGGTTNYTKSGLAAGSSVNLSAPANDPAGYTFSQWVVNGSAQAPGQKAVTFAMTAAVTAVARYTANTAYALTVQSTPASGIAIGSSSGEAGTTNYVKSSVSGGTSVELTAPATATVGGVAYAFSQWALNGAAQAAGVNAVTFTMGSAVTAVAQYTKSGNRLTVESTPPTGLVIGSSTGQKGTTNYYINGSSVAAGSSVNLAAPAGDPAGYTFAQWVVNGTAQTAGQKAITFTMGAGNTVAAAEYSLSGYALTVKSTPPAAVVIGSGTGQNGTTSYSVPNLAYGTVVNLQAPANDPGGYAFEGWTLNGAAQTAGQKAVTFTMGAAVTAVAQYTANAGYTLTVQSNPPAGVVIGSSTGHNGTTNYSVPDIAYGTVVNLQAPAADPAGYAFAQWTVNGSAQTAGQKAVTFTMSAAATAAAQYTLNSGYLLTVQSTPPAAVVIGSGTGQNGTTNYTAPGIGYGTLVNLIAPAADPAGYGFVQWTVNGAAQTAGQKSVTFTMAAAVTAVAHYTVNTGYALSVQSTPPSGVVIGSSTGQGGTTSCTKSGLANGTVIVLTAPASDPAGYTFSAWTVNGAVQTAGQKSVAFALTAAVTAVAQYTANAGYALVVQSTPATGVLIGSSSGHNGTTNYTIPGIGYGTVVNLAAPASDPAGYTFSQWTLNGSAQTAGQKAIGFTMDAAVTAVAQYTANAAYTLVVQSTPAKAVVIGSSTGHNGTTNYNVPNIAFGTSVNLAAPAADPAGYTFSQWALNGAAQGAGQKTISFAMYAAVTAVAQYTANAAYTLVVQSTPATAQVIGSSTGHNGTTNYSVPGIAYGTVVNLAAPAADPAGYTFSGWTLNATAQTAGQKAISFTLTAAVTAVAHYTANIVYTLNVQSTPATAVVIGSSTGHNGTTNYAAPNIAYGTVVNLAAPATDPAGFTFAYWTLNGAAQPAGQKAITFGMTAATTAVAQYKAKTD